MGGTFKLIYLWNPKIFYPDRVEMVRPSMREEFGFDRFEIFRWIELFDRFNV